MVSNASIDVLDIGPTRNLIRVSSDSTDGAASVVEMVLPGGWVGPPDHVHASVSHVWIVTAGDVVLRREGDTHRRSVGDSMYIAAGVRHGFSTEDTDGATVVQVDTPGALDGYLRDLAEAFPPGAAVDPAVVGQIMARHDTTPVT